MYNHIVIGHLGEVGTAVSQFICSSDKNSYQHDSKSHKFPIAKDMRCIFLHICINYQDKFLDIVKDYIKYTKPKFVIVYSTVPPGTTEAIGENAVHSPIDGKHPHLSTSFKTFTRFVSGKYAKEVGQFFSNMGLNVKTFENAKTTELGKILSTSRYGINLVMADESNRLCKEYGLNFDEVVLEYQKMYNAGYKSLGLEIYTQPLLTPPNGEIGGHCVVNNAMLLCEKSDLIRRVSDYGKIKKESSK